MEVVMGRMDGGGGSGLTGFGECRDSGRAVGPVGGCRVGGGIGGGHHCHAATSPFDATDESLVPPECRFRCKYCDKRCARGHKDGHTKPLVLGTQTSPALRV